MFWISAFLLGLVGSLHCGVMCGPIVLAISSGKHEGLSFFIRQVAYNLGRILTYLLLGAVIGLIGKGLSLAGFQQSLSILSGLLLLALYFLPRTSAKFRSFNVVIQSFTGFLKRLISPFFKSQSVIARFMIGVINGFLPCGLVYVAAAGAIATGEPTDSAMFMTFFGMGTIPMLLSISTFQFFLGKNITIKVSKLIPMFVLTISLLFILRGLNLGIPYVSPQISESSSSEQTVCE